MRPVQSPERELRFTRSAQAVPFWVLGASALAGGGLFLALRLSRGWDSGSFPHPLWVLPPLLAGIGLLRIAWRLTRHAYLILTPLGMEIFPFLRPAAGMRLVSWGEIHSAEADADLTRLTLHHDAEKTAGIHLSLRPIKAAWRPMLVHAVLGRVKRVDP
jgi:hypothetical protein